MNEMNPSFDPLKLDVRDNTEATPTSRFFGGGRKMVRLVVSENDKMVNLAAVRLSEQGFKEAQEKLAHAKGLSIFRLWVPVTIKKDGKEESILINIRSAAKRLGVSKQVVFEAAKSGTFQELLRSFNPVSFQGLKKTMESASVKVSLEPFSKMCTYIALNRQKLCKQAGDSAAHVVYQPDPSGLVKGFLFYSDGTVFIHCKSNIPGKDFIINADSQEHLACDEEGLAILNAARAQNIFHYFQTTVRDAGVTISSQKLLEVCNYIVTHQEDKLKEMKKSLKYISYEDSFLSLGIGIRFDASGDIFIYFDQSKQSEVSAPKKRWVAVIFHEAKWDKTFTFSARESDTTEKIADSHRKEKAAYFRVGNAIHRVGISSIPLEEIKNICSYIALYREEKQKEAANSLDQVSYVRANKPPHNLARGIQFNADGTVFIHFNKERLHGDKKLGEGGFKKVRLACNFDTGEPLAVARLVDRGQRSSKDPSGSLAMAREFSFLQRFKDSPGIAQAIQCVKVNGNVAKTFFIQPLYERDLFSTVRSGKLSPKQKAQIALDLLKGAQELEKKGVIHRDIKPGNVFLDAKGRAYIADFGIALDDTDLIGKQQANGTRAFCSPEYISNFNKPEQLANVTTFKHDMWALGCTIYTMLNGNRMPTEALVQAFRRTSPFGELVFDLLQKDPSKRLLASEVLEKYETQLGFIMATS
ncbi:MAG: protein kinase family protein [Chlamydiales bacterium]|nr:protein kinase family protein [Chlamydiales bacterium]